MDSENKENERRVFTCGCQTKTKECGLLFVAATIYNKQAVNEGYPECYASPGWTRYSQAWDAHREALTKK